MNTSDFDYELPQELIAQTPAERRDGARMMVLHPETGRIEHRQFIELPEFLMPADLLVMNNTQVIPARVSGRKKESGGAVELFFLERLNQEAPEIWEVLLKSSRRPKPGQKIEIEGSSAVATFLEDLGRGQARVAIDQSVLDMLDHAGTTPLPPYIRRGHERLEDKIRYQTLFARSPGAVAAPTAGLHFTPDVLNRIQAAGGETAEVTLHVGLGTFQSVEAENLEDHLMHSERYECPEEAAAAWIRAREGGGRVIGVGSTSVRTLETVAAREGAIQASKGRSDLFIYPPYSFKAVDAMLTNFHLPRSSLIMMVSALAGHEFTMEAYRAAVAERYRFYSYGDCMLIV
jgi:S-adenosylmethionine:tRNA ribosyltransferase-isomerase